MVSCNTSKVTLSPQQTNENEDKFTRNVRVARFDEPYCLSTIKCRDLIGFVEIASDRLHIAQPCKEYANSRQI